MVIQPWSYFVSVANKYEYESEVSGCRTLADESERTPTFYVAMFVSLLPTYKNS